jgi:hypothetical protein
MQATCGYPARDRVGPDPAVHELFIMDGAPLGSRDPGDMGDPHGERTGRGAN